MRRVSKSRYARRVKSIAVLLATICVGCSGDPESPPAKQTPPTTADKSPPDGSVANTLPTADANNRNDATDRDTPLLIARLLTVNELTRLHWKGWQAEPEMRVLVTSVDRQLSDRQRLGVDWQTVIVRDIERVPPNCRDDERQTLEALSDNQDELLRQLDDGAYSYARVYRQRVENQHCITCHDKMLADDTPTAEDDEPRQPQISAILMRIRFPDAETDEEH